MIRFACVALVAGVAALSSTPVRADAKADEAAVIAYLHETCDAYERGDADAIERLVHPEFQLVDSKGVVTTRANDIDDARKKTTRYSEFRNHDMAVKLYGDTAVVRGITTIAGESVGEAFALSVKFTDTVVREDGRWRIVASHVSRFASP